MATNINMTRKGNIGLNEFPTGAPTDYGYMAMNKSAASSNFPMPLSNNQMPHNNETAAAAMGSATGHHPFSPNHYGQAGNSFGGLPSRQFENPVENAIRPKFSPLPNSNMAAGSPYPGPYTTTNENEGELFPIARFPGKFRASELFNVNKALEQANYAQGSSQRPAMTGAPWLTSDYPGRNIKRRSIVVPAKGLPRDQGAVDPTMNQNMNIEQSFPTHGVGGSSQQQPSFPMQSQYMAGDAYKHQAHLGEQQFSGRGMGPNFHAQDLFQQEHMRQLANAQQYQQSPVAHQGNNYMAANQGNSPGSYPQTILPKPSQDPMFQQFAGSPKANGPHPLLNMHNASMVDSRQVSYHNPNYPVSPVGSQMPSKPGFSAALSMRGTVSPNVTIGLPKKPFPQPEETVVSPAGNQNAAAAAAAAAVLAAINAANPHTSPQSTGDVHSIPSRPPSIHAKDLAPRSPATSLSDHKSESGGSGINEMGTVPSPAKSLTHTTANSTQFTSDIATGRVPSPSVNQLPSTDIEAMIHSVSNVPGGNCVSSNDHASASSRRTKREIKSEALPKLNTRPALSPVTPPSPFSLSPSITDFELDILSPSWEDPAARNTTPVNKLYKASDDPERKAFLDKLILFMEQQGKSLGDVPTFNGAVVDLYKFFKIVSERGGFNEVIRMKQWKEVVQELTNSTDTSVSDSQILREQYMRYLLPFDEKSKCSEGFSPTATTPVTSVANSAASYLNISRTDSPSNPQPGSIDLSTMSYKNLPMFQPPTRGPTSPFSQGPANQATQLPSSYPGVPSSPQGYSGTPPIPRQAPGYHNMPPSVPSYHGAPSTPRLPGYAGSPSPNLVTPGYQNHGPLGYPGMPSAPGYHNPSAAGFPGMRNAVAQEATYLRDQLADFARGVSQGMNRHYQNMPNSQQEHPSMFSNFQQQSQQPPGMMYQQQQQSSNLAGHPLERARAMPRPTDGMASPKQRIQAMRNQWGHKYPQGTALDDPGLGMGPSGHSPFHPSQSSGHKLLGFRPPPPYPHLKGEKSSPTANSASPHQTTKSGALGSPGRKTEGLFPPDCVEATKPVYSKKRRLTARDLGPVEAWRIMMSLKSGLLSETTWALDTLTILLCDNTTVGFFRLAHLPGLLDTIIEHFRRNIINVFGILVDSEVDVGVPRRFVYGSGEEVGDDDKVRLLERLPGFFDVEDTFSAVIAGDCLEDEEDSSFCSGRTVWADGGGDTTIHLQTHFETDYAFYEGCAALRERKCEDKAAAADSGSCESSTTNDSSCDAPAKDFCAKDSFVSKLKLGPAVNRAVNGESTGDEETPRMVSDLSRKVDVVHNSVAAFEVSGIKATPGDDDDGPSAPRGKVGSLRKDRDGTITDVKRDIYCNGGQKGIVGERTDSDCTQAKLKAATNDVVKEEDFSAVLIKRLKADLDLELDSLSEDDDEDVVQASAQNYNLNTMDDNTEVECELKQEFPLSTVTWSQISATKCCTCVSNIIRSLSFVPGNDVEMARHPSLLLILGKLLLLHHLQRRRKGRRPSSSSEDGQYNDGQYWWYDCLETVRENALVTVANIAGYLDLSLLTDAVSQPLLDGLLHWLVCQSAAAVDTIQTVGSTAAMALSPKHLVLETLAKMSVLESNVDFILMSPDKARLTKVYDYLVKLFSDKTNEVTREFALVLLSSLTQADGIACCEKNLVTVLVGFLEDAKETVAAMAARGLHPGFFYEDDMRVSMGMLRRAAGLLACIAKRTNSPHLIPYQERILALSMSRVLDVEVQSCLSNVLYNLPR